MLSLKDQPLIQILNSEQNILLRTDQKAYTLLSILGVFMVFFIVHYANLPVNWIVLVLLGLYFISAFLTIFYLVRTVIPRVKTESNPTFFAGIIKYSSSEEFYNSIKEVSSDEDKILKMFSEQVYALGQINQKKNTFLKWGIIYFVFSITFELLIIATTFINLSLDKLF